MASLESMMDDQEFILDKVREANFLGMGPTWRALRCSAAKVQHEYSTASASKRVYLERLSIAHIDQIFREAQIFLKEGEISIFKLCADCLSFVTSLIIHTARNRSQLKSKSN